MPRKTYTAEEKEAALRLCSEIGVLKASEETGISVNSLYAWRGGKKNRIPTAFANDTEALLYALAADEKIVISGHDMSDEETIRLRVENEALLGQVMTLKNALRMFTE